MQQNLTLYIEEFRIKDQIIQAYVPDYTLLKRQYEDTARLENSSFPFWGKVWPSAIALCNYVLQHPDLTKNKTVLELAAGLGIPSFFVASAASSVICSDLNEEAVAIMKQSIELQGLSNVTSMVLDWQNKTKFPTAEVVFLSDVNYHKEDLDTLYLLVKDLLAAGTTLVLSTPERIIARDFIQNLQPYIIEHTVERIDYEYIHLYVLSC